MSTTPNGRTIGGHLRDLRETRQYTAADAQFLLRSILPESQWVDASTITRLETRNHPRKIDLTLIAALCDAYKVSLPDEFPELAEDTAAIADLLARTRTFKLERRKTARVRRGGSQVVTHIDTDGSTGSTTARQHAMKRPAVALALLVAAA